MDLGFEDNRCQLSEKNQNIYVVCYTVAVCYTFSQIIFSSINLVLDHFLL